MSKEDKDIEKELSQDNLIYEHVYKNSKQNLIDLMREDLQNARNTIFMLVKDLKIKKKIQANR